MSVQFHINEPELEEVQETIDEPIEEELDEFVEVQEDFQETDEEDEVKITFQDLFSAKILSLIVKRHKTYIIMVLIIMFGFVYNSYRGSIQQVKLATIREEVKEERYKMLGLSQQYSEMTRATGISKRLRENNSQVKESDTPPTRIK